MGADNMTTCERVDAILQKRGISRRKLAIMAHLPPSSLQSALSRNRSLSLDMLIPISEVLEVSVEYLYFGYERDEVPPEEYIRDGERGLLEPGKETTYRKIMSGINCLNEVGQKKVLERIEELLELPKYQSEWKRKN